MIGKRRLDRALEVIVGGPCLPEVKVHWRVFQLNPSMPPEGMDRAAYLAAKFGGAARAGEIYRAIRKEGAAEGIDLYLAPSLLLLRTRNAPSDTVPLYLQEPSTAFRFKSLDQLGASYIQFKANIDYSGQQDIDAFVDSVAGKLRRSPPGHIILDQRFNYGGDLNTTRELMQKLTEYLGVNGKLFLITSGQTFSAGISSVGYAKQAAGERAVIVGEPVGDALEFWAEGELKVLPNSGVAFLMATERHNYISGCQ